MKIGPGVSELWGGPKSPSSIDLAHGLYNSLYYRTSRDKETNLKKSKNNWKNVVPKIHVFSEHSSTPWQIANKTREVHYVHLQEMTTRLTHCISPRPLGNSGSATVQWRRRTLFKVQFWPNHKTEDQSWSTDCTCRQVLVVGQYSLNTEKHYTVCLGSVGQYDIAISKKPSKLFFYSNLVLFSSFSFVSVFRQCRCCNVSQRLCIHRSLTLCHSDAELCGRVHARSTYISHITQLLENHFVCYCLTIALRCFFSSRVSVKVENICNV